MTETHDDADEGEILKANTFGPEQIHVGMDVMSLDGEHVGRVKEINNTEILIDRRLARDLWVPLTAVMATEEYGESFRRGAPLPEQVVLNVTFEHVDGQGWRHA